MSNNASPLRKIRFIDLFCGIGGTRLGLERACEKAGIECECVLSSDKKKAAQIAYKHNFGEDLLPDVVKIDEKTMPDFDFLLAGIPCQAFSRAGKRRGLNDTRGTMFFEVERILAEKKPRYVLIENVPEITTDDHGNTIRIIRENLEALGYAVSVAILDGTDFGLAQARRRAFITGVMGNVAADLDNFPIFERASVKDIIEAGVEGFDTSYTKSLLSSFSAKDLAGKMISDKRRGDNTIHSWDFGLHGSVDNDEKHVLETLLTEHRKRVWAEELGVRWRDGIPMNEDQLARATGFPHSKLRPILDGLVDKGYLVQRHPYCDDSLDEREDLPIGWKLITSRVSFELHRILDPDDVCITLTATDCSHIGVVDGDTVRRLTVRECLRLFGFPDSLDLSCVSEAKAYDLVGNSICVPVVAAVAKNMLDAGEGAQ